MNYPNDTYCVPIWLSNWTFKDSRNKIYTLNNQVVKGHNKEEIFANQKIVNKLVNKIKGRRSKQKLVALNLTLTSQHGYGVEEN
tara:strand:+ start:2642 stop:2893 length:252 start_codon:yes stop_codon:yes gene_type:complete